MDTSYRAERRSGRRSPALLDTMLPDPSVIVIEDAHWLDDAGADC